MFITFEYDIYGNLTMFLLDFYFITSNWILFCGMDGEMAFYLLLVFAFDL